MSLTKKIGTENVEMTSARGVLNVLVSDITKLGAIDHTGLESCHMALILHIYVDTSK